MKVTELLEARDSVPAPWGGRMQTPQDAPIRKAKQIASKIDDLFVDMMDELLDAQQRDPKNEDLERVIWYFNNDEYTDGFKELRRIHDK